MVKINIIDIGARYGIHPTWQEFKNEGNFYLIDADKSECSKLKRKYSKFKNVKIFNNAISDKKKTIYLNILKNPAMSSTNLRNSVSPLFWYEKKNQEKVKKRIKVKALSLDDFVREQNINVDFLKIDVEGDEKSVITSSKKAINNVLGIRCEVNFLNIFNKKKNCGSFNDIHKFLFENNFLLLNLDYKGIGDHFCEFVLNEERKGILQSTDAVWIKNLDYFSKTNKGENILKVATFLFLNNAPDLAIWILNYNSTRFFKYNNYKKYAIYDFLHKKLASHFYKLKWSPGQSLKKHKKIFEKILDEKFPDMNKFNESKFFNPL